MDEASLRKLLSGLPVSQVRYFDSIGSTNDEALAWASAGAPDFSLVYAEQQTSGRGRMGRKWFTPPATALALSLVLRPTERERQHIGLFAGLAALALASTLEKYGIAAQIKWPNDVLIKGSKTAGILVEAVWMGGEPESVVMGIGVNVAPESVPPVKMLSFPATCILSEAPSPIERFDLLRVLVGELVFWRSKLASDEFIHGWNDALAFRGETVQVWEAKDGDIRGAAPTTGQLEGIETDGSLRLRLSNGKAQVVHFGEVHLRPL